MGQDLTKYYHMYIVIVANLYLIRCVYIYTFPCSSCNMLSPAVFIDLHMYKHFTLVYVIFPVKDFVLPKCKMIIHGIAD